MGAPIGNKNAAGPHTRRGGGYNKRFYGQSEASLFQKKMRSRGYKTRLLKKSSPWPYHVVNYKVTDKTLAKRYIKKRKW